MNHVSRFAAEDRHIEGIKHQLRAQVVGDCPTDDAAAVPEGSMMTLKTSIRTIRAAAALISATLLPLDASATLRSSNPMNIPGVISYNEVPASEAPQGGRAVDGLVVSLSTTTPAVRVSQPVPFTVTIANVSPESKRVWAPYAPCAYGFSVMNLSRDNTKDVTPVECIEDIYSLPARAVSPGMATRLQFTFDSDGLSSEPGRYNISVRTITLFSMHEGPKLLQITSNSVSVVVTR